MPHEDTGPTAVDDLKFFGLILIVLVLAWYFSGGYTRYKAEHGGTATSTATSTVYVVH